MELEEVTQRLAELKASNQLLELQVNWHQQFLWALLELLHKRGVVPAQDVVNALQSRDAFARAAFAKEKSPLQDPLIESLQAIADALPKFQRP